MLMRDDGRTLLIIFLLTIKCWTEHVGVQQCGGGPFGVHFWRFAYFRQSYDCVISSFIELKAD